MSMSTSTRLIHGPLTSIFITPLRLRRSIHSILGSYRLLFYYQRCHRRINTQNPHRHGRDHSPWKSRTARPGFSKLILSTPLFPIPRFPARLLFRPRRIVQVDGRGERLFIRVVISLLKSPRDVGYLLSFISPSPSLPLTFSLKGIFPNAET